MNERWRAGTTMSWARLLAGLGAAAIAAMMLGGVQAAEADMQGWIDEQIATGNNLAISAAWQKDGQVTFASGGSLAPDSDSAPDQRTQFQIGSITKPFTDLLLAELAATGEVSYESTVAELLAEDFEFQNAAVGEITLQQLATHTSGLPRLPANLVPSNPLDPYAGYEDDQLLLGIQLARSKQPLGTHYAYSNFGVGLLGWLIGNAQGDGYEEALLRRVIEPLGLTRTGFAKTENLAAGFRSGEVVPAWTMDDALAGAGALWGTTDDLMRLADAYLAPGQASRGLAHNLMDDLEIVVEDAGSFSVTRVWHVAQSETGPIYWHNGGTGGYWSFFGFRPSTNEAVAILVSGDTDPTGRGFELLGRTASAPEPDAIDASILGQYELAPGADIGVFELNGALVGQLSGQPPLPLSAVGDDWYAVDVADASVRFVREEGEVVALELAQNGVIQTARRTGDEVRSQARESVELPREELEAFVGEYPINGQAKFTIRLAESGLEAQITGQPYLPIYARGGDIFFYKVVDAELHFERDEAGQVNALVLHQGAIVQRAERSE